MAGFDLQAGFAGLDYFGNTSVTAQAGVEWFDYLNISNPFSTLRFTTIIDIHDISTIASAGQSYSNSSVFFTQTIENRMFFYCLSQSSGDYSINCPTEIFEVPVLPLHVGRNILTHDVEAYRAQLQIYAEFVGQVSARTTAIDRSRPITGSASIDAFNTARTYVTLLTPGATLTSASGHDYSLPTLAAVPEPASWAMMIAGFGLVGGALRASAGRRARMKTCLTPS